jgi:hypothetical protein
MANPIIFTGSPGPISGSTPFGFYDTDTVFKADGPKVANYVARKLGYPVMEVELDDMQIYSCFEESISIYSEEVYHSKIKDNYLALEGASTGSLLNNQLVIPSINSIINLADNYGAVVGIGGYNDWHTGSLALSGGVQVYDLQKWGLDNGYIAQGDRMVIERVFYETRPAVNQFYDPALGGSINYQGATENFGWASYSPGLNFQLFPVSWDIARVQEIEMSNMVRKSAYSFELINNKLRIFPVPDYSGFVLNLQYSKKSELSSISGNSPYGTNQSLITNPSNVPYGLMTYSQINQPGKQWIYEYTLALCSELLGLIRGKYTNVAIPGSEVSLNGADLIAKGKDAQTSLREKLRQDLEDMSRRAQLERKQSENASISSTLNEVPMFIYIGSYILFMINQFIL